MVKDILELPLGRCLLSLVNGWREREISGFSATDHFGSVSIGSDDIILSYLISFPLAFKTYSDQEVTIEIQIWEGVVGFVCYYNYFTATVLIPRERF